MAAMPDAIHAVWAIVRGMKARGVAARMPEITAGEARGIAPLVRQIERKLGRSMAADDHTALGAKLAAEGPERVGDAVLDLTGDELARWLADTGAR